MSVFYRAFFGTSRCFQGHGETACKSGTIETNVVITVRDKVTLRGENIGALFPQSPKQIVHGNQETNTTVICLAR